MVSQRCLEIGLHSIDGSEEDKTVINASDMDAGSSGYLLFQIQHLQLLSFVYTKTKFSPKFLPKLFIQVLSVFRVKWVTEPICTEILFSNTKIISVVKYRTKFRYL